MTRIGLVLIGLSGMTAWAGQGALKFTLPSMQLCKALVEFAHQSNIGVMFAPAQAHECELQTQPVFGEFVPRAALRRMLAGVAVVLEQAADDAPIILRSQRADSPRRHSTHVPKSDATSDSKKVAEVVVTGSLVRNPEVADVSGPLMYLTHKDLLGGGYGTVEDALYALPVNSLNAPREDNLADNNYQFGSGINLRGLSVGATLVLVNGRRQPLSGFNGDFVDVSNIPSSAVDHIEVLPEGASAIYGSDAIAGVVNIIMRDDIQGFETQARYGGAPGGRNEVLVAQLAGTHWKTGRAGIVYEYRDATALAAARRQYAADADKRPFGGADYRSYFSNPGNILEPTTLLPVYGIASGQNGTEPAANSLQRAINLDNQFSGYQLFPQTTSKSLYATLSQEVSDGDVEFFADGRFTQRDALASKSAWQQILAVPRSNPFYVNPFSGSGVALVAYDFLRDFGASAFSAETRDHIGTVGERLRLDGGWLASCAVSAGRETLVSDESNVVDPTALDEALASPNPATAFNPFADAANTSRATLESIRGETALSSANSVETASVVVDGPLFYSAAGPVRLAIGLERRQESLRHDVPHITSDLTSSERYSRDIRSAFAELAVPLLGGPDSSLAAPRMEANLAGRFVEYSDFGKALSPSARLQWVPIQSLKLRASWTGSFRAPTLDNLYDSSQNAAYSTVLPDPRSSTGQSLVLVRQGTNSSLGPQTATTVTGGIDLTAPAVPGLRLSLTYYEIDYEGQIATPALNDPRDVLVNEYEWASVIKRNPSDAQVALICNSPEFLSSRDACLTTRPAAIVDLRLANLGLTRTSGVDMDMREQLNTEVGGLGLRVVGSRVFHFDQAATSTSPGVEILNTLGGPLGLQLRATTEWTQRAAGDTGFAAQFGVNYTGRYRNPESMLLPNIASSMTFDLQLRYRTPGCDVWWSAMEFVLKVVNVSNRWPPFVDSPYGYDVANVQPLGRVTSLYWSKRW